MGHVTCCSSWKPCSPDGQAHQCPAAGNPLPRARKSRGKTPGKQGERSPLLVSIRPGDSVPLLPAACQTLSCSGGCCLLPFLLKTFAAEHRPALRRLERDRRFQTTRRASSSGLRAYTTATGTLCFALLAVLGVVLELFVVKKQLFPGRKDEIGPTVDTLQHLVLEFH